MKKEKIIENNIIIAKFMKIDFSLDNIPVIKIKAFRKGYHRNWQALMPVVEKIESIIKHQLYIERCSLDGVFYKYWFIDGILPVYENNKLHGYYEAVIKFIKWYNKHNEK